DGEHASHAPPAPAPAAGDTAAGQTPASATASESKPGPAGKPGGEGEDSDAGRERIRVDLDGLPDRLAAVPVPEARYSSLRAVAGGLVWLRSQLAGVLGESQGDPDDDPPRPSLERFDLGQRRCSELVSELDWFEVSGDGERLLVFDHDDLRVLPA